MNLKKFVVHEKDKSGIWVYRFKGEYKIDIIFRINKRKVKYRLNRGGNLN
jgi:hypothetical protein